MGKPLLPPGREDAKFKKEVKRQLRTDPNSQMPVPIPYPASPYGGNGPPDSLWFIPVTSATFTSTQASQPWLIVLDRIMKVGFSILIPFKTDVGTTGEVRLNELLGLVPGGPTSAISLPANTSGNVQFNWLHGMTPYTTFDCYLLIEARRTAGAGNVNIGFPLGGGHQVGPEGCTDTGV
jgi:hypothetical protein